MQGAISLADVSQEVLLIGGGTALAALAGILFAVFQSQEGGTMWQAGREAGGSSGFGSKLPREDAVLVFGATGRLGRTVVQQVRGWLLS